MAASPRRPRALSSLLLVVALLAVVGVDRASAQSGSELLGTFRLTAGGCGTGSYFRMILPTGSLQGPWVDNEDSSCADGTYTPLTAGSDGGLLTGGYQPAPSPGFDADGNSLATRLLRPVPFFGVDFSASTNPTDLQTNQKVPAPSIQVSGGKLSGDLSAFAATWNDQAFNQGSPKPGGARPGLTSPPTGTYDSATGAFTLTWTSQIVGGPFNSFTGLWHLEGTFAPAGGGAAPAAGGATATTAQAPAAAGGEATATTAPGAADAERTPLPTGEGASDDAEAAVPAGSVVEDEGFEPATWLVVLLAALGIGGVIALLVLGPGSRESGVEGA